jgi:hypothetical protein
MAEPLAYRAVRGGLGVAVRVQAIHAIQDEFACILVITHL